MDFAFSSEQDELRGVLRRYLASRSPDVEVRRLMATTDGYDPVVWKEMAGELGLQGIMLPEVYGGSGFGFLELSVILEEMGRTLLCSPYFSTVVLAAPALVASGDAGACSDYLPSIASGDLVATFAIPAGVGDTSKIVAVSEGDGYRLEGVARFVVDGHRADLILVPARLDGSDAQTLFAISSAGDASAAELVRTPLQSLDATRKLARVELGGAQARLVGERHGGDAIIDSVLIGATVALAAEQVGICQWGVAASVEYARDRIQFGRSIGSFQAIKHKCVDLLVRLEAAKATAYYAAWAAEAEAPDLGVMSALAKAECSEAALEVTTETLHIHGGIGFTWEHPAHLYLKRARSSALFLGDPAHHRERICQYLGV